MVLFSHVPSLVKLSLFDMVIVFFLASKRSTFELSYCENVVEHAEVPENGDHFLDSVRAKLNRILT